MRQRRSEEKHAHQGGWGNKSARRGEAHVLRCAPGEVLFAADSANFRSVKTAEQLLRPLTDQELDMELLGQ